jgi:hypothetical protein
MEHFIKDYGPWVASAVGTVLTWFVHRATSALLSLRETVVKADLAFKEVSERVPEVKSNYDTWLAHRKIL